MAQDIIPGTPPTAVDDNDVLTTSSSDPLHPLQRSEDEDEEQLQYSLKPAKE